MKICGIYCFEVVDGNPDKIGWMYIGQANNLDNRHKSHRSALKRGGDSKKLQQYYNKYGKESLKYKVLMICRENELDFWEKWFIKSFDSYPINGFNLTKGGDDKSCMNKPCRLKNVLTNEIVNYPSIKEFAEKYGFCGSYVGEVINGKKMHIGGWHPPEATKIPEITRIVSPEGIEHTFLKYKSQDFRLKHNISCPAMFCEMLSGKIQHVQGWRLPGKEIPPTPKQHKNFTLQNIYTKEAVSFASVEDFGKQCNFSSPSQIRQVLNGKRLFFDGWCRPDKPYTPKRYKVEDPEGNIYEFSCIRQFARERKLPRSFLRFVGGEISIFKNWKVLEKA